MASRPLSAKEISYLPNDQWVEWQLSGLSAELAQKIHLEYQIRLCNFKHVREANNWLREHCENTQKLVDVAAQLRDEAAKEKILDIIHYDDDTEIRRLAVLLTDEKVKKAIQEQSLDEDRIIAIANFYRSPKDPKKQMRITKLLRMEKKQATSFLNMAFKVLGSDCHYATEYEIELRNQQKKRNAAFGERIFLIRGEEKISMREVMMTAHTRMMAEIFTLLKGIEDVATEKGFTWACVTLTAPARMHSNPSVGDSSYDLTNPKDALVWLHKAREGAQKRHEKKGINVSGVWVVHPHKDACPHIHILIFARAEEMKSIEMSYRYEPQWRNEPGLVFMLDNGISTASSYMFKHVLNIVNSLEMLSGEAGAIDAWRSTWVGRGHQFFGIPSKSLWRTLRDIKELPTDPLLATIWGAAQEGDGYTFIKALGGLNLKRKDRPVSAKETGSKKKKFIELVINETGEVFQYTSEKWQKHN